MFGSGNYLNYFLMALKLKRKVDIQNWWFYFIIYFERYAIDRSIPSMDYGKGCKFKKLKSFLSSNFFFTSYFMFLFCFVLFLHQFGW